MEDDLVRHRTMVREERQQFPCGACGEPDQVSQMQRIRRFGAFLLQIKRVTLAGSRSGIDDRDADGLLPARLMHAMPDEIAAIEMTW